MKNNNKIILLCFVAILFGGVLSGCMKETIPTQYATQESLDEDPSALYNGSAGWMVQFSMLGRDDHWDFGYPAYAVMTEMMGQDVVSGLTASYERFQYWINISAITKNSVATQWPWNFFYGLVATANKVIALSDPDPNELASAYTYRAFAYFNLVNLFQHTYKGNESKPAVPIILETTTEEEAGNNPRATVQAVYDLILSDLEKAETLFPANYKTAECNDVDLRVMQGVAARVYLSMENWGKARDYAALAKTGFTPLSRAEFLSPTTGFNDMTSQKSWMWALHYTENDDAVQTSICNFTAMMSNDFAGGYAGIGSPIGPTRSIGASLYEQIPANDWRKATWMAAPGTTDLGVPMPKYASRKFRPMGGDGAASLQVCDFPMMRVEEMMLIEAEATAMGGNLDGGKTLLNSFLALRSSGDAPMTSAASTAQEFQDEVWMQRRIELWGEGFTFIDIKRLGKSVTRSYPGTNFIAPARYNTTGVPAWYLFPIVITEEQNNKALIGNNNPDVPMPKDVDPATL